MSENGAILQNILLVDDRPENLIVLENILENTNANFIKANSGEEALKLLLKNEVALILLDVQMPVMDGFETAKLIRGAPRTKHIPIIFVTAISKEEKHIFKGYETGAVDYLFKPIDPDILKSKVNIFLELDLRKKKIELKNQELEVAQKNMDNILKNVTDGLFLLDYELNIKPQYSLVLEQIFMEKKLDQINFITFLDKKIPEKMKLAVKDYLELMHADNVHEKTLIELNPFTEIEVNFKNKESSVSKILTFTFKRVLNNDEKLNEIIVTVKDITDTIQLAKKLEESEAHSKRQMELAFNILHVEPPLLQEFMEGAQKELSYIDNLLKDNANKSEYKLTLEKIFRSIHLVKGNASLLDLKFFINQAHEFEEKIINIQKNKQIGGSDFVPLVLHLGMMQHTLIEINNMIERSKNIHTHFRPKRSYENKLFVQSLENLITRSAKDFNKEAKLVCKDFDLGSIPYQFRLLTKEILIQLIRNAISHGIEEPDDRRKLNKNQSGSIEISSFIDNGNFGFKLRDDGKGLQIDKLRKQAKESGKWKPAEIDKWNEKQIAEIILIPGISTSKETTHLAGRGVGMDSIKDKLDKIDGKIEVSYKKDEFCEFAITIPIPDSKN